MPIHPSETVYVLLWLQTYADLPEQCQRCFMSFFCAVSLSQVLRLSSEHGYAVSSESWNWYEHIDQAYDPEQPVVFSNGDATGYGVCLLIARFLHLTYRILVSR